MIKYFNEVARIINNERIEISEMPDLTQAEKDDAIETFKNKILPIQLANSFLNIYSLTEEWFLIFRDNHSRVHGLDRFKNGIKNAINDQNKFDGIWSKLKDFEMIRHCLLHANGRIDIMHDKNRIPDCAKRMGKMVKIEGVHLVVTEELVRGFTQVLRELMDIDNFPNQSLHQSP